ncbi:hypothetical protein ACET6V_20125 [Aeromonas caviae]|uniref:hypothetical protein n=1 Tax=Aeromonas caviae TaxID=648 RepID=UPI0038D20B29
MHKWLVGINNQILSDKDKTVAKIYVTLLNWIIATNYRGGCHDTSAIFHIILNEENIENTLCIGEVKTGDKYFDHSWIEIDGLVYDPAVCMPLEGGRWHPPVFKSNDLDLQEPTKLVYGAQSPVGLDDIAKWVSLVNLGTYALAQPDSPEKMWHLTSFILMEYGLTLEPNKIKNKYKKAKRKHVLI